MVFILFIALCIAVQTSLVIHFYSLMGYIATKKLSHFRNFMITAGSNIMLSIGVATIVVISPKIMTGINLDLVFILESGMLFVYMMAIKIRLTMIIISRVKNPDNYHLSHFGKKIYHTTVVDFKELLTYFLTLPFTMMSGAFFIVKMMK